MGYIVLSVCNNNNNSNIMPSKHPTSWGLCCAAKICNDFALALNSLPDEEHVIKAVAARSLTKSKEFAEFHDIPKAYGSYDELAMDEDVEIVYIGSIHTYHYDLSMKMLSQGKHVLCEKPLCVNVDETRKLLEFAKEKGLFFMEGVWSRCFPAYKKVREILDAGLIGEVKHVGVTFGSHFDFPLPRIERKDMAGGALMDIGIYTVQFAQFVYNDEKPISQLSSGTLLEDGVDGDCDILLKYPGGRSASLSTSVLAYMDNKALVHGTKGYLKVGPSFWCPTTVELFVKHEKSETFHYELPSLPAKGAYHFGNSQGFQYEATEVRRCLTSGCRESPLMRGEHSLNVAEILEKARRDIGYSLPQDEVKR